MTWTLADCPPEIFESLSPTLAKFRGIYLDVDEIIRWGHLNQTNRTWDVHNWWTMTNRLQDIIRDAYYDKYPGTHPYNRRQKPNSVFDMTYNKMVGLPAVMKWIMHGGYKGYSEWTIPLKDNEIGLDKEPGI
jgi:hypothetical protein